MSTVPVFAPSGELGDIPAGRLQDAVKAGFQPGVHVQSADGQDGVIPAHRTADAVKAGMTVVPIKDQPIQHEGFWSTLGSDLGGMLTSATSLSKEGLLAKAKMFKEAITGPDPREAVQSVIDRANAGYGPAYAALAPTAEQLGVNVKGMEQSAQQGDVGGVAGHAAAVPATMAAGAVASELPLGRIAKAGGAALKGGAEKLPIVGPVGKGMIRGAVKSWRASAPPDVEIPASKVSTTPPESVSKASQLQQSRALQNVPVSAVQDKSAILSRLQQIAQQPGTGVSAPPSNGPPLRIAGQAVPADTNLAPALEKSLPQNRVEGKIMQVVRREGGNTLGRDQLMRAPELKGISPEQVQQAVIKLRDQGKIWHESIGGGAHEASYTVALKKR